MNLHVWLKLLPSVGLAALVCVVCPVVAQTAPSLGQAGSFSVLGASAVTNTGSTIINGDLGIWPNTASSISGFPPGIVVGTTHPGDAVAQQAQSDLTTAYNDLAGRACNTVLTGTDLGGLTLTPGVYCFTSAAQLTGTLTLDAQGNPNAVFIFQIGTSLTTSTNARVLLTNGGSNCNVFWQVGSSATMGTGTVFAGNVLALTSITLTTGASVSGRVLARNGAVTLDTNNASICGAACNPIVVSPASLPAGNVGATYSQAISATGGTAAYTFSLTAGSLPPGFSLNPSGLLSGIASSPGSSSFSITASDAAGCQGVRDYTLLTLAAAPPTGIPTLSEWGFLVLLVLLAFAGVSKLNQCRVQVRK